MSTVRYISGGFPSLKVTKQGERILALLLTLHQMNEAITETAVVKTIQQQYYWRGKQPDWTAFWEKVCLEGKYVSFTEGRYQLTEKGLNRLHNLCTLLYALRPPFRHLTSSAYLAASHLRQTLEKEGRRPFTSRSGESQQRWGSYYVYVILLHADVAEARSHRYLVRKNPGRSEKCPFLYVGCTGTSPEKRFEKHRYGIKASKMVRDYGVCLVPDLYVHLNPIDGRGQATEIEANLLKISNSKDIRFRPVIMIGREGNLLAPP